MPLLQSGGRRFNPYHRYQLRRVGRVWLNALVLKTSGCKSSGGSNPSPSAIKSVMTEDEINDLIEEWHNDDKLEMPIYEFLGWTRDQYASYVERCVMPEKEDGAGN